MNYSGLADKKYLIMIIIFLIAAGIIIYKGKILKKPEKKVDYAYNIILDKKHRYSNVTKQNDPVANESSAIIPERVIRRMIPGDILDKYYPDSLKDNMPHRRQIEHFDTRIIDDPKMTISI